MGKDMERRLVLAGALALLVVAGGCTLLKGEYSSTSTEVKQESGLEKRMDAMESRMERIERSLERIERKVESGS